MNAMSTTNAQGIALLKCATLADSSAATNRSNKQVTCLGELLAKGGIAQVC